MTAIKKMAHSLLSIIYPNNLYVKQLMTSLHYRSYEIFSLFNLRIITSLSLQLLLIIRACVKYTNGVCFEF